MNNIKPLFSIIVPTRDRPDDLKVAVDSLLSQKSKDFEVIVVVDGSTMESLAKYKTLDANYGVKVKFFYLIQTTKGHGHCFVRNYGVSKSLGLYIAFLDDDDEWIDSDHLFNVGKDIKDIGKFDLYLTNQYAVDSDGQKKSDIWIAGLSDTLSQNKPKTTSGTMIVSADELLKLFGFCHMNCLVISKELFLEVGGMDECLRYEPDRDIYNRAIDTANLILFNASYTSKHNIPDPSLKNNASTMISLIEKKLFQLRTADKGILFSTNETLRSSCKLAKHYHFQHITEELKCQGKYDIAIHYGWLAFASKPSFRWFLFLFYLYFAKSFKS